MDGSLCCKFPFNEYRREDITNERIDSQHAQCFKNVTKYYENFLISFANNFCTSMDIDHQLRFDALKEIKILIILNVRK